MSEDTLRARPDFLMQDNLRNLGAGDQAGLYRKIPSFNG